METTWAVLGDAGRSVTMMRQFSIRTLLLCTTLIAIVLGLVVYGRLRHSQAQRVRIEEQQLIAKIDSSLGTAGIYVAEPGVSYSGDGSVVYLMPTGPGIRVFVHLTPTIAQLSLVSKARFKLT